MPLERLGFARFPVLFDAPKVQAPRTLCEPTSAGVDAQQQVTLRQPVSSSKGGDRDAFKGYTECTMDSGFVGNYFVFRKITSDNDGEICISPEANMKDGRSRFTALQVVYRGK